MFRQIHHFLYVFPKSLRCSSTNRYAPRTTFGMCASWDALVYHCQTFSSNESTINTGIYLFKQAGRSAIHPNNNSFNNIVLNHQAQQFVNNTPPSWNVNPTGMVVIILKGLKLNDLHKRKPTCQSFGFLKVIDCTSCGQCDFIQLFVNSIKTLLSTNCFNQWSVTV